MVEKTRRAGLNWQRLGLRLAGAGLLAATGAIHLDLYLTGYRSIPVIGWLFLLQVIAAFGLAAGVPGARAAAAAVSVAALVLLGVAVAGAGGLAASAAGELRTAQVGGVTVLANAKGFTLYSFAPDTPSQIELQRDVCWLLATSDRDPGRRPGRDWHAEHDQAVRRHDAGRLPRASPVHLRR
jgi:hypothetical protein